MDRFIVGSNAFFSSFPDFVAHDQDVLILEDDPRDYSVSSQMRIKGNCYFRWRRMTADEFLKYHKQATLGLLLGKFLVPSFVKEIGVTIEQLKELRHLRDSLDEKHRYEKYIYDCYIENDDFVLSDEQLKKAYKIYRGVA